MHKKISVSLIRKIICTVYALDLLIFISKEVYTLDVRKYVYVYRNQEVKDFVVVYANINMGR